MPREAGSEHSRGVPPLGVRAITGDLMRWYPFQGCAASGSLGRVTGRAGHHRHRAGRPEYSPAWPHGELKAAFSEVFFVIGTNRTHHTGVDIQTSRTMTAVREGGALTLLNTVRLDDTGLRALEA